MKKSLLLLIAFLPLLFASYKPAEKLKDADLTKKTNVSFTSLEKGKRFFCGAAVTITNPSGLTVTSLEYSSSLGQVTVYNPSFPYTITAGNALGSTTFLFQFSSGSSGTGSFKVSDSGVQIGCEDFDTRYLAPFVVDLQCMNYFYAIAISSSPC